MADSKRTCIKCDNVVDAGYGKDTSNGFVCNDCLKKRRRALILLLVICALIAVAGYIIWQKNSKPKEVKPAVVEAPKVEESKVEVPEKPAFNLANTQAVRLTFDKPISEVGSFQSDFEKSVASAEQANANTVGIPTIATHYKFRRFSISKKDAALVQAFAEAYLKTDKTAVIVVEGYACSIGKRWANNWISKKRAQNVASKLVAAGIPQSNIEVKWYGETRNKEFRFPKRSAYRRAVVSIKE